MSIDINSIYTEPHKCFVCRGVLFNTPKRLVWDKNQHNYGYVKIMDSYNKEIHTQSVVCPTCGLVQVYEPMTENSVDNFYRVVDGVSKYRTLFQLNPMISMQHTKNTIEFIRMCMANKYLDNVRSLIDIGSGSESKIEYTRSMLGIQDVYCSDPGIPESKFNIPHLWNTKYDVITIINTLEHIYDPVKFLKSLQKNLTENGSIIICVPDLLNTSLNVNLNAWFSGAHLYHFDNLSLYNTIAKAGYMPIQMYQITEQMGSKIYTIIKPTKDIPRLRFANELRIAKLINYIKFVDHFMRSREELMNGEI